MSRREKMIAEKVVRKLKVGEFIGLIEIIL